MHKQSRFAKNQALIGTTAGFTALEAKTPVSNMPVIPPTP